MNRKIILLAFIGISFGLAVTSGFEAYREGYAYVLATATPGDKFATLRDGTLPLALSYIAQQSILDGCSWAATSFYGRSRPTVEREQLLTSCAKLTQAVANNEPTNGYAWFAGAENAIERGDVAGFNRRLKHSHLTGMEEGWLAARRVALSEDHYSDLNEDTRESERADLAMLVRSGNGIASVAQRYVYAPAFRKRIAAIVATLPTTDQLRFLSVVGEAARATTSKS